MRFRNLRADEIECRVGQSNKNGFSLLLYKDARCDMNILDETGVLWTRRHYECKGNLFCEVGIWDDALKQFIYRSDCGTESNTEKEKGEASDSFKRACVNWGIGRELYTTPFIYIKDHVKETKNRKGDALWVPIFRNMKVEAISYSEDGKKITRLVISGDGETIYEFGRKGAQSAQSSGQTAQPKNESGAGTKAQSAPQGASKPLTLSEAIDFKTSKGKCYSELTDDQLRYIVGHVKEERCRQAAQLILKDREDAFEDLELPDEGDLLR